MEPNRFAYISPSLPIFPYRRRWGRSVSVSLRALSRRWCVYFRTAVLSCSACASQCASRCRWGTAQGGSSLDGVLVTVWAEVVDGFVGVSFAVEFGEVYHGWCVMEEYYYNAFGKTYPMQKTSSMSKLHLKNVALHRVTPLSGAIG